MFHYIANDRIRALLSLLFERQTTLPLLHERRRCCLSCSNNSCTVSIVWIWNQNEDTDSFFRYNDASLFSFDRQRAQLSYSLERRRGCLFRSTERAAVLVFDSLRELLSHLINCRQAAVEYSEDTYCNSTVMLEWRRSDPFPLKHPLNSVDSLVYAFTVLRWCLSTFLPAVAA